MKKYLPFIPNAVAALILLQTLFFKFSAHPQSVALFEQLALFGFDESVGRIGVGVVELLASFAILFPRTQKIGALGVMSLMAGALYFHATVLGFAGDNMSLTVMAAVALGCAGFVMTKKSSSTDDDITVIAA